MTQSVDRKIRELRRVLLAIERVAVAVSGGVDSMTLARVAHHCLPNSVTLFHAVSPAVPPEATERTRRHAEKFAWNLKVFDAGEFSDPEYLRNPLNRCFYCKANLYGSIAKMTSDVIVSGTNLDDMSDFRPGLHAATQHQVRHPYVEAKIDKAEVRAIADRFELDELASLPASPCLSSRIETGIGVDAKTLGLVHAVENAVRQDPDIETVRCRVRREGLVVELDPATFDRVVADNGGTLQLEVEELSAKHGYPGRIRFEPYRMGSAFLRGQVVE